MSDQKLFVDIIQKRIDESFLVLDFEIDDDKLKPNVIIHEEISGDDYKLVKYLIKNFHKRKLRKPYLQHIYQIIALLVKKHKKYYGWLREIQLPKLNKFIQIEHKELYLFVPKIDEICNRVVEQYLRQDILYNSFISRLKELLTLIKRKDSNEAIESKLNKILKSIFVESDRLLDTESLTSNNPCLCLNKKSHKEFLCYLKEIKDNDKTTFKIDCTNFKTNSFYTKIWDKVKTVTYNQLNFESQKIHFIGVDEFHAELFINSLLKKLWMPDMLVNQLTAYTCEDKGNIVYQSIAKSSNLDSLFRRKENKNNFKMFNSLLLQLYGSLLTLQDPEQAMMLLHNQLGTDSIQVAKSDKESIVFEEFDIDDDVLETVVTIFEKNKFANLEQEFIDWLNERYGFELNEEENNSVENDIEDDDEDEIDDEENDEEDDNTNDNNEYNNDQEGGVDDENDIEDVDNDDEDDEENKDYDEEDEDNNDDDLQNDENKEEKTKEDNKKYEINLVNNMQIMLTNFNKASISTLVTSDDESRTLMRLYAVTSSNVGSNDTIEQIDYDKYTDIGSTYTLDDYTPGDNLFYLSFDTYYSFISFLLDEANRRIFFKNKHYQWIWNSIWESEKDANKIRSRLFSNQKGKRDECKILEILQGVTLLNSATYILFLKMFYLQDNELL